MTQTLLAVKQSHLSTTYVPDERFIVKFTHAKQRGTSFFSSLDRPPTALSTHYRFLDTNVCLQVILNIIRVIILTMLLEIKWHGNCT